MNRPQKVFHIGDVHIFFDKNFEAHNYVFNEFYKDIEKEKPDLIVCCGDLIDSKIKVSGEQFELARSFLFNLASTCPVILILGNHDVNLKNKERIDMLSPIVNTLNSETVFPIHFFKHSGVYNLYNIKWAVWSCLDDQLKPEIVRTKDDYVVGLFHGAVKGCVSENGFVLTEGTDVSEFDDTDITMMSDIHSKQMFRNNEIVYSGSLVQTKVSESANGSYVLWTLKDDKYIPEYKEIKNIYSTLSVDFSEMNIMETLAKLDEKQFLIVKYDSEIVSKSDIAILKKELQSKFKNKVELKPLIKKKKKAVVLQEADKDVDLQNAMEKYLLSLKLSDSEINNIIELDKQYSKNLDLRKDIEYGDFSLLAIEVNNFLPFAPKTQKINFDREGIVGIAGKNKVGKSSILSGLLFGLFNSSRDNNSSLKKLINKNNRNTEAFVKLYLYKKGKYYKISRTLIPKKGEAVKTTLEFFETDEDWNEIKSLTGEKRQDTEKEIQKYFGDESAFETLTLYSAQTNKQELIDCKNAERLKLVNRFIGSNNYEVKHTAVSEDLRIKKGVYQNLLKSFNQSVDLESLEAKLVSFLNRKEELEEFIADVKSEEELEVFKNRHLIANFELTKKIASKIVANPGEVAKEIETIIINNTKKENIIKSNENLIKGYNEKQNKLSIDFTKQFNGEIDKFKIDSSTIKTIENEHAILNSDIAKLRKQLLIDVCTNCNKEFTESDKRKVEKELASSLLTLERLKKMINDFYSEKEKIEELQKDFFEIKISIGTCEKNIFQMNSELSSSVIKIENIRLKSKDWDEVEAAKKSLVLLEHDFNKYTDKKKDISKTIGMLQNELSVTKSEIKFLENTISNFKIKIKDLQECETEMNFLKSYKDIISKDGLPLYILQSKIAEINEQVNLIISQVFDFEVEFAILDGELNISFFYENDEEKNDVGFASGSETFIINLCIKVGLAQVSELPKLTSLIIDEGYGTLDAETIAKIPALFLSLPEYYKNIITVSHIEELKELYNYEIKLEKKATYTEITN